MQPDGEKVEGTYKQLASSRWKDNIESNLSVFKRLQDAHKQGINPINTTIKMALLSVSWKLNRDTSNSGIAASHDKWIRQ